VRTLLICVISISKITITENNSVLIIFYNLTSEKTRKQMTIMETLTYQHQQPKNWLYEIKQKGDSQTCYVMVQNAKDLVKSHLMFAVREEVEVLKEKINELMDRINQLEVENTILKANASQETLSQLTTAAPSPPQQQQQQQQSASPVVSQNPPSQTQQITTPSQPQATQPSSNTQNQAAS
jgi:regulator of replication initiation timing